MVKRNQSKFEAARARWEEAKAMPSVSLPRFSSPSTLEQAEARLAKLSGIERELRRTRRETYYLQGKNLIWIKDHLPPGEWLAWQAKNVHLFDERTAQFRMVYAPICDEKGELLPYSATVRPEPAEGEIRSMIGPNAAPVDPAAPVVDPETDAPAKVEFYTHPDFIEAAREVLGGTIDIDPASNPAANERVVRATKFYSKEDSGLDHKWPGTVFCNPPFGDSQARAFAEHGLAEFRSGRTTAAIFLFNMVVINQPWFQALILSEPRTNGFGNICIVEAGVLRRLKWWGPDAEESPGPWGIVFVYLGEEEEEFREVFREFGVVGPLERML